MQNSAIGNERKFDCISDQISAFMPLDDKRSKSSPLNSKLQSALQRAIELGVLGHGDQLPTETQLSRSFGVSVRSVKNALEKMVGAGVLRDAEGQGKFVSERFAAPLSTSSGFSSDAAVNGHKTRFQILSMTQGEPSALELDMLELSPGDAVTRIHRVRFADDKPVCVELACLPASVLPFDADITNSLYAYLAKNNLRPVRGVQRMRAELLAEQEAQHLNLKVGSPCLFVEQQSFVRSGAPIEYVCTHYRGDAYDFIVEMKVGN